MLRIGKLTDYATVLLATLAADRSRLQNAGSLAERTRIAAPTHKCSHNCIARAWHSTRGTTAVSNWRGPSHQRAGILDALEGPFALTDCSAGSGQCGLEHTCSVGRTWQKLNLAIRRSLNEVSLAQLAGLDNRAAHMPIERELRHIQRSAKAST